MALGTEPLRAHRVACSPALGEPTMPTVPRVLETPPALPEAARAHYAQKLALETDVSDVHHSLTHAPAGWVLVDARSAEAFAARHIPGAQSLPHRTLSPETTGHLNRD